MYICRTVSGIWTKFSSQRNDVIYSMLVCRYYFRWNSIWWRPPSSVFVKNTSWDWFKVTSGMPFFQTQDGAGAVFWAKSEINISWKG